MIQQAELVAARIIRIDTTTQGAPPEDVPSTDPTVTMSPVTPTGLPTTGFMVFLKAPSLGAAVPPASGAFPVTPWIRNPVTKVWAAGLTVSIGYDQAFCTGDVDAAEIYFQVSADAEDGGVNGEIDIHFAEL